MTRPDDDERGTEEAWRSIVDNYGERPAMPDDAPRAVEVPEVAAPRPQIEESQERFVPPPPPPLPRLRPRRALAWAGVLGAPVLLLVLLVLAVDLPAAVGYALVAWFVGGFGYLVATMPSGPRDPWDDGSRV